MSLQVTVNGLTNNAVPTVGYELAVHARPRVGCQGRYQLRLVEKSDPEKPLSPLAAAQLEAEIPAQLTMQGIRREYTWSDMHVQRVQTLAGPLGRSRLIEARYHHTTLSTDHFPQIVLRNDEEDLLDNSPLGNDFTYSLLDARHQPLTGKKRVSEQVLSFESEVLLNGATVVRFVTRRNQHNSWMVAIHRLLEEIASTADNRFAPFHIDFPPCSLEVRAESLSDFVVEEVYGSFLHRPLLPLAEMAGRESLLADGRSGHSVSVASLVRSSRSEEFDQLGHGLTFEIATLVFQAGHYRELALVS